MSRATRSQFIDFNRIFGREMIGENGEKWLVIRGVRIPDRDGYVWRYPEVKLKLKDGRTVVRSSMMRVRVKDKADAETLAAHGWAYGRYDRVLRSVYEESLTDGKLSKVQKAAIRARMIGPDYIPGLTTGGKGSVVSVFNGDGYDEIEAGI